MARKTSTMPTLFKRSNHGCYCFRRVVGSKRITINTNTTDYTAAKQFLRKYLQGEGATTLAVTQKQHIGKIASAFAQAATRQSIQKTLLTDAFDMWQEYTPALSRNSDRYKQQLTTYFNRFYEWCQINKLTFESCLNPFISSFTIIFLSSLNSSLVISESCITKYIIRRL